MATPEEILKKYWGYNAFRPLQSEIIEAVIQGKDCLALLPTGGGKSICFQVPAMARDGLCLVISPLIALMNDQVQNLTARGIPALAISSILNFGEVNKTLKNAAYGNFKFLYVSPERLESPQFLEFLPLLNVSLIAVDEAHCISQWGYDFRPSYLKIAAIREHLPNVSILALTASATESAQQDIAVQLHFGADYKRFQQSFERPNLSYSVFEQSSKQNKLLSVLKNVGGTAIVYCKSRKRTKEIASLLNLNGVKADFYHAGLSAEMRTKKQDDWIQNKTRVICCTNAFGMGIDKPDVRSVVHFDIPDSLENYYQEAGRAGRDGKKSYAVLLYNQEDILSLNKQSDIRFPGIEEVKKAYAALCNYFQIAEGCGEGQSYDFDINLFAKYFQLDILKVSHILKIFEQEELIHYSEQFFEPSTIIFTTNREELEFFEKQYPALDAVIKGLLRSYDGIFDNLTSINETALARFLGMKREDLVETLHEIFRRGVIEYHPQKEIPQVKFLHDRVSTSALRWDAEKILKRKTAFEGRLSAMLKYTSEKQNCRSKIIGNYFNDQTIGACGICDNCLKQKNALIRSDEFKSIAQNIKNQTAEMGIELDSVIKMNRPYSKEKILKVIHYLLEENEIATDDSGKIYQQK